MRKSFLCTLTAILFPALANAAMPFAGTYQTIDDETNTPKSIVQIYEYMDDDDIEIAGRIIALYGPDGQISETLANPTRVAENVKGKPKMVGLDIIWGMEWEDDERQYEDGKIMDPKSGKVYSSVMWQETPEILNVRGKIGPFGRTQKWNKIDPATLPAELQNIDTNTWRSIK